MFLPFLFYFLWGFEMVNRLTDLYFRMVLTGIWSRGWTAVSPKYSVPVIKAFRRCLALLIVPSKSNSRIRKIGSRSSFSGLMALNHRPVFPDKKVIICVLCLIQFVNYSTRNAVVYRTEKKVVFCWLFQLLCKINQALFRWNSPIWNFTKSDY